MFSNEERMIYAKRQLVEVICQLRFPEILSIDASEPAAFQDRIRREYPQYEKKIEQLPPQMVNGKPVPQGTVNNYQFVSAEGQWKISLTKGFIALSTYGYTRWRNSPSGSTAFSPCLSRHIIPRGSPAWVCGMSTHSAERRSDWRTASGRSSSRRDFWASWATRTRRSRRS